jgi:ketosteroid isomerase-like protein
MSQANVEAIRALSEAYLTGEALARLVSGEVDPRFVGLVDPEIEWDVSGIGEWMPSDVAEVYRGYDGVLTYWRRWLEAWRDLQSEILDVRGAGDAVVVLIHNARFWGRHSGIRTELPPFAMVYTFREGKVVRMRAFPDHESALKAVGLVE